MTDSLKNCHVSIGRRDMLRAGLLGSLGLTATPPLLPRAVAGEGAGKAKSCIVLYCWGGMSQLESWDPKPEAPKEVRGDYKAIATATPGVNIGELLPKMAQQTHRLAIVRSCRHRARDHRQAVYWTLTGVPPLVLDGTMVAKPVLPTREDKPCLGAMVAAVSEIAPDLPATVTLPYPVAERGLVAGQNAGFLGVQFDPMFARPKADKFFLGVSPQSVVLDASLLNADRKRMQLRQQLLAEGDRRFSSGRAAPAVTSHDYFRELAAGVLTNAKIRNAFDLEREPAKNRETYGNHIFGRSVLLARRLTEIGIPLVTVNCGAGDLNGGIGAIWDTHFVNFPQLKKHLMPPFDLAASALLNDLAERGKLDETLVVLLTEFGRQPVLNKFGGRDHLPDCYSIAFAGGGIQPGQVYGRSDRVAATVEEGACGPGELHATVFHALGIDPTQTLRDASGRSIPLSASQPLDLF